MIQSYNRRPSLDNAYARVRRAKQHLTSLKHEFALNPPASVSIPAFTTGVFQDTVNVVRPTQVDIPPIVSILIGETIYNLRAALDYLVYELAILDSGKIQKRTQFPIEDRKEGWDGHVVNGGHLKGLSAGHQAAIKRLQPFCQCKWPGLLRDISDPDKHRFLISLEYEQVSLPSFMSKFIVKSKLIVKFAGLLRENQTVRFPGRETMKVQRSGPHQILFDEGHPVIETLQEFQTNITNVLDAFKPDFK
jgi:hypothetical protein